MDKVFNSYLEKIYYQPQSPGSFTSRDKIWRFIRSRRDKPKGLTLKIVEQWLQLQDTPSVYKSRGSKFKREKIIVSCRDEQWSADLMDTSKLKKENDNVTFILVIVDIFSKFCWAEPLINKKAETVKKGFTRVFDQGCIPQRIWVDAGSEFQNNLLKVYFKEKDVHMFIARSESKSVFAERLIKTLKLKMYKYMYHKQTYKYIDVLSDIVYSYNNSYHNSIKMAPMAVNSANELDIYTTHYMPTVNKNSVTVKKPSFAKGDLVRLSHAKGKFTRSFRESFTEEIFKINYVILSTPPRYTVEDGLGEKLKGSFYAHELALVHPDDNRSYKIDKIIKYRNNKRQALVSWYGYSSKFNSWIPSSNIKRYK